MPILEEGSNRVVASSVKGNIFPTVERETIFSLLIDGTQGSPVRVHGSVYGRSLRILGDARVDGPIVSRGDVRIEPQGRIVRLLSGLTVNGSINVVASAAIRNRHLGHGLDEAWMIVRGDVTASHNIFLSNTIVFGSIRAQNCKLDRCIVLGTIVAQEKLTVSRSAIAGYTSHEVTFEGPCTMIHAIGESARRPLFVPHEDADGITAVDLRYYPILRPKFGFLNLGESALNSYPSYSRLDPQADWVAVQAPRNAAFGYAEGRSEHWVLSLGGRVADFTAIQESIEVLAEMLKCGFEFEHYHPNVRERLLQRTLARLAPEEACILTEICQLV